MLFFVSVGMLFDPLILIREPLPVLATFLVIVLGKSVAAYVIVRAFGHPKSTALTISASLAQIGEFSFILIGLGLDLELMPQTGRDLLLAGAILSILVNPLLFIAIGRWQARQDRKAAELPPEQAAVEDVPPAIEEHDHAILIGYGRVGRKIALRLREAGTPLVVIEDSRAGLDELREAGISAVLGNAARPEVLELAQLARARWLLLAIPNGFEAGQIAQQARVVNPRLTIIARAHFDAEVEHLEQNGADLVIMGEREIARAMIDRVAADQATPDAPVAA